VLDSLEFKSQQRKEIFLVSKMNKEVPGPTQPPVRWVLVFSPTAMCQGVKLNAHLHVVPRLRTSGAISPLPLHASMEWRGKTFTFTFEITIHPNWSTIRLSRGDGARQNLCKKNCKTVSVVLGVSFRATAT